MKFLKNIFLKIGLDKAILFTILTRIIQAGGSIISIIAIARYLTDNEQGYYYTFLSIIAVQVFFELGLSGIITQYTAHEFVHLRWSESNELEGDTYYKSRLSSLLHFCVRWFGVLSIGLFALLIIVGFIFFTYYNTNGSVNVNWHNPWIVLCLATSLNLFIDPVLAFYEGLGEVKDIAKLRLIQKTSYLIFLFIFFAAGFKLYSSAMASVLSIAINYLQIVFSKRIKLLRAIWKSLAKERIIYMKEIFPYQWRIALSWISGFFIFQLFSPVLFATQGAKAAGQMGMTLQALNGVSALSMSWISTKIPLFSSLIAKKNYKLLDTTFNVTVKQLAAVNLFAIVALIVFVQGLRYFGLPIGNRFLNIIPLSLLCMVNFINQFIFSWATYLRCHKREPFLINSVVMGVLCALSTILMGHQFGLYGIVAGYAAITAIIALPWSYYIFKSKKLEWHKSDGNL